MRKSTTCLAAAAIAAFSFFPAARGDAPAHFTEDFAAARGRAEKNGRPLFILFTGSDWCVWCKRLEKEVFSKPEFLDVATNAYELVAIDFPEAFDSLPEDVRKERTRLRSAFEVRGFPTVVLADAALKQLYTDGYRRGGAKRWIDEFRESARIQPLVERHIQPFREEISALLDGIEMPMRAFVVSEGTNKTAIAAAKAAAEKTLPALKAIQARMESAKMPQELDKAKAVALEEFSGAMEYLELLATKSVDEIAEVCERRREAAGKRIAEAAKAREEAEKSWLFDWSENMRTNTAIETFASLRDKRIKPFLRRHMDPGNKATAAERKILEEAVGRLTLDGVLKKSKNKKQLAQILSRTASPEFTALLKSLADGRNDFGNHFVAWLEKEKFSGEDLRCVAWLQDNNFTLGSATIDAMAKANIDEWLVKVFSIDMERRLAWNARGGGWASTVTDKGWDGFKKHGDACRAACKRAMELHPFPEPEIKFSSLGPFDDAIFTNATAALADAPSIYENFLWYNCYPRWCGSHKKMKLFAERCRATGRHDTMIPVQYAYALLRMIYDMEIQPEDYFKEHPEELDRILEVSLPQIKNKNATNKIRQKAGAYATLAWYLKGDYEKAAEVWRSFPHHTMPNGLWETIYGFSAYWTIWDGISGKNRKEFQRLHALYEAGDHAAFLKELAQISKRAKLDSGESWYAGEYGRNARLKVDFPAGKPVAASFPKNKNGWLTYGGAWRLNGKFAFHDGKYSSGDSLEWSPPVPTQFKMACVFAPTGKKADWHFEFHVKPGPPDKLSRYEWPYIVVKPAGGKYTVALGEWEELYKSDGGEKAEFEHPGGPIRLAVVAKDGKLEIFAGDAKTPLVSSSAFKEFFKNVPEGKMRFNGTGVRLEKMSVVRP